MAAEPLTEIRVCSKCGAAKAVAEFGYTRAMAGRKILRAQCRTCYNIRRREHYSMPTVHEVKTAKRSIYQRRPDVAAARKAYRSRPEVKAKAKTVWEKYRSKPETRARMDEYRREYVSKPETRALYLFGAIKLRAAKKGLPFNLTLEWIAERVLAGHCELTGLPFDYTPPPNGWRYNPSGPSVDQIVPGAGYTLGNCRVILTSLNNALSQYGDDYFAKVAEAFLAKRQT